MQHVGIWLMPPGYTISSKLNLGGHALTDFFPSGSTRQQASVSDAKHGVFVQRILAGVDELRGNGIVGVDADDVLAAGKRNPSVPGNRYTCVVLAVVDNRNETFSKR